MMFRNFTLDNVEQLGDLMLAVVALLIPVLVVTLFLTNRPGAGRGRYPPASARIWCLPPPPTDHF